MRISGPFMLEIAGNAGLPSLEILVNEEETTKFGTTQISYDWRELAKAWGLFLESPETFRVTSE